MSLLQKKTTTTNSKTFLERLEMEIRECPSNTRWIDSKILIRLSRPCTNYEELQKHLVRMIKQARRRDFFPVMISPHIVEIYQNIATMTPNGWLKFFLCEIGIANWRYFNENLFTPQLFSLPMYDEASSTEKLTQKYLEFYRMVKKDIGLTLSSYKNLHPLVVNQNLDAFEILKFLIDECGADPKCDSSLLKKCLMGQCFW
ncbi:hypothetical protein FDP41_008340 [Naegleria fowleri]|uniref:Uncharacterized protein n=1 Tax=Naegleria fowleri TaxID=5763 RepID=A0A6A5B1A9_NAEFO|nr:uncharacterized protein FDP41_008340 [Naegleria fowleri]KAF0973133.1 hypothetical protein FDP41_008340 [Naegleria fowleri]